MDPNANLEEQLTIVERINACRDHANEQTGEHQGFDGEPCQCVDDAERLAELVEALDGWIRRGGFLPDAWRKGAP